MKKVNIYLITVLIITSISLQKSFAQTNSCPANHKKAEKVLKEYLSKKKNIKSLRDQYGISINKNTQNNIQSLSGEKYKEECQQLKSNLDWLTKAKNYSIYKIAKHYFIVIYSSDKNGKFQMDEIPIVNSELKAIGSIISFGSSK